MSFFSWQDKRSFSKEEDIPQLERFGTCIKIGTVYATVHSIGRIDDDAQNLLQFLSNNF